jgi:hypothetical protein
MNPARICSDGFQSRNWRPLPEAELTGTKSSARRLIRKMEGEPMSVVERAFEIAREGKVLNLPELKTTLRGEGYNGLDIQAYLSGNAIRFQLMNLIQKHSLAAGLRKSKRA